MKGIFITGTDTDVGKTIITAGLLKLYRSNGIDAVPMKPVQTGCESQNGKFSAPDLDFALDYSKLTCSDEELKLMAPHCYEPVCSPHLAGSLAGKFPEVKTIISHLKKLEKRRELVLAEGAGGIMVPLNKNEMMLDLMKATDYPVILVSHTGLGTINHTLLSIETLRRANIEIMGVIFNNTKPPQKESAFIREDNIKTISNQGKVKILGIINHIPDIHNNFTKLENEFKNIKLKTCEERY